MIAVLDDGHVDVEDVAIFKDPVTRDAVADLVIDGGADGLGKGAVAGRRVVERGRDGALHVAHVGVAEFVQPFGGGAGHHEGG